LKIPEEKSEKKSEENGNEGKKRNFWFHPWELQLC
jgi:hypothetical protein